MPPPQPDRNDCVSSVVVYARDLRERYLLFFYQPRGR